jgi:hypothetical protein
MDSMWGEMGLQRNPGGYKSEEEWLLVGKNNRRPPSALWFHLRGQDCLEEREDWNTSVPLSYCWKKPLMTQGQLRV